MKICFISRLNHILGTKCVSKHEYLHMFGLKLNKYMSNSHALEVVGRGSETQLQVGESLNCIM